MRWQLSRAGLFNFWYYDEEEFGFADGKLLLRGSNGSGKSVTMQSLIPVLLDGRKTPDRLDPFGSRARRMEDYLLGEKEVSDLDERTGYLYLEYHRPGTKQYLTTGIGLKAKRHSPLDFWGFVILDNQRIGEEIKLYKLERSVEGQQEKVPLTRRELTHVLGEGGEVLKTQQEYMERVNRYLFGFKSIEDFNDLIKLLIQLRSPKLSKDFRPTVIYDILNESLPSLADEELRPLSDTIENMDQIKSQLDQLQKEEYSLKRLLRPYEHYNHAVLTEKADSFLQAHKRLQEILQNYETLSEEKLKASEDMVKLREQEGALRREQEVLNKEKDALESHDVFKAEKEKNQLSLSKNKVDIELKVKEESLSKKQQQEIKLKKDLTSLETQEGYLVKDLERELEELDLCAEEAAFLNHEVAADEFKRDRQVQFSFTLWQKESQDYYTLLEKIIQSLRKEEQAKENYQTAEIELGEAKKDWDDAQFQEKKWGDLLGEEQRLWIGKLYAWHEQNQELHLEDIELQTLTQRARLYPERVNQDELREPLRQGVERTRNERTQAKLQLTHEREQVRQKLQDVENALESWRKMKDPEPSRHPLTTEARRALEAQSIPFVPFYGAVEFKENVSPELRERLENALKDMGILDALIIPEQYLVQLKLHHDRILKPNPQILAHTLADYLDPSLGEKSGVAEVDVDNILRTILVSSEVGTEGTTVVTDGSYTLGLLKGHAPQEEVAQYIGKEARRQLRLREIAKLETEKEGLTCLYTELKAALELLQKRKDLLEQEFAAFPGDQDMREAYRQLEAARGKAKILEQEVQRKDDKFRKALEAWRSIKTQVKELSKTLSLPLDLRSYEEARQAMDSYRGHLSSLVQLEVKRVALKTQVEVTCSYLEATREDVDELKGEINSLKGELQTLSQRLELIETRLQELGVSDIRERVKYVVQRLGKLPEEIEVCVRKITQHEGDLSGLEKRLKTSQQDQDFALELRQAWAEVFQAEDQLQTSFKEETEDQSKEKQAEQTRGSEVNLKDLVFRAERTLKEKTLPDSGRSQLDRESLREKVNDAYTKEMSNLVEYRLTQQTTSFEELGEDVSREDLPELWRKLWEELSQKARRLQLVLEYNGRKVNPFYLKTQLEQSITLQRQLLNDKDRELYEEIIMNSVGRIIRGRIQRAEHWVETMNKLMDERDTSSGLRFRIRWKPLTAEHEDEMDTQSLVNLLKSDPRLLKESDMSEITHHFRAKIERAKQQLEVKGYGESFHQIIKQMLDYRQWFEFRLLFLKEGESWKELTDRAFNKFSGGEKAMAMYIPLFSAAYSRYSDAHPDAPRIITLDEAFAGVDENNIRDMFDLLEKLELNYIMNSQALWGDYDSVSHLAIAELIRPKNAPYVTVIRYTWDGKVRRLMA